jgi:hypothetical protein
MPYIEDLARIRVNDAIQTGLQSQEAMRGVERRRWSKWKTAVVLICLAAMLVMILATCSAPAAASSLSSGFRLSLNAQWITILTI